MYHHACIAVVIAQEVVHCQVGNDLILVHDVIQVILFIQLLQAFDQAGPVLFAQLRLGVVENIAVALEPTPCAPNQVDMRCFTAIVQGTKT